MGTCRRALCAWSLFLAALFFLVVETDGRAATPISASPQKLQRRMLQSTPGVAKPADCSTIRKIAIVGERHSDVNINQGNRTFENVIVMRCVAYLAREEAKINSSLSLARRWGLPVEVVRWEDMLYPEMQVSWVKHLAAKYKLPLAPTPRRPGCMGMPGVTPEECKAAETAFAAALARRQQSQSATLGVWAIARSVQAESYGQRQQLLPQQQLLDQQEQQQQQNLGGRRMAGNAILHKDGHRTHILVDIQTSASSGDRHATDPSQSSLPGHERAPGVQPVTEDARDFVSSAFSTKGRVISSAYLNLPIVLSNGALKSKVQAVNEVVDAEFEASLGYHRMDV
ncbi:hypothetical protein N2152v2_001499 [Parachlorella kessleri]